MNARLFDAICGVLGGVLAAVGFAKLFKQREFLLVAAFALGSLLYGGWSLAGILNSVLLSRLIETPMPSLLGSFLISTYFLQRRAGVTP